MTLNPTTNQPFTTEDADRLLGLGDQFMEDWEESIRKHSSDEEEDGDCAERRMEWDAIRPLLAQAPAMLAALGDIIDDILSGRTEWHTNGTLAHARAVISKAGGNP